MSFQKTVPTITRGQFLSNVKPLQATIDGHPVELDPKNFSTGSLGWFANPKIDVAVAGVKLKVQVGITLTVVGSKELPVDEPTSGAA